MYFEIASPGTPGDQNTDPAGDLTESRLDRLTDRQVFLATLYQKYIGFLKENSRAGRSERLPTVGGGLDILNRRALGF